MLSRLTMKFDTDLVGPQKASLLQGVLFNHIDSDYAAKMHTQNYHPYSQYAYKEGAKSCWVINSLNDEAYDHILSRFYDPDFTSFHIDKSNLDVTIIEKNIITKDPNDLLTEFYKDKSDKTVCLKFITPTAFKQNGNYVILPDIRLIFRSLMHKYGENSDMDMLDEDTLEQLETNSYVSGHRITSIRFPMEGIAIPGFIGDVSITIKGTETMRRYARMLLEFGEYSGVGIKTAMGMGAVRIVRKGAGSDD